MANSLSVVTKVMRQPTKNHANSTSRYLYRPVTTASIENSMSELLKIKLTIADRVYPLSVAPEQEEALRASAKKIEAMIKQLEQNRGTRQQDVLAMCALQYATQVEQNRQNEKDSTAMDTATLDHLNQMIEEHMATF